MMHAGLGLASFAAFKGTVALVGTVVYVASFALGAGAVPGLLVPEITPAHLRGTLLLGTFHAPSHAASARDSAGTEAHLRMLMPLCIEWTCWYSEWDISDPEEELAVCKHHGLSSVHAMCATS